MGQTTTLTGGAAIRAFRKKNKAERSLEWLAEQIAAQGYERPSAAKLSRIETGQTVPTDLIPALERVTGISRDVLRPDLAALYPRSRR